MNQKSWEAKTRHDLIVEVWEALDCESVGGVELERIQEELRKVFGPGGVDSPAAIARTLADEGAVLRHPEVLNLDTCWREADQLAVRFEFSTLSEAYQSMAALESWRREIVNAEPESTLPHEVGLGFKVDAELVAGSKILQEAKRELAREVAQWLSIWLQNPEVFAEWLDLRKSSPEFNNKFREEKDL